ncbi:hypothetical protein NDU88_000942 [Pleurodeles waltl]|uniref:Uncharacterized protein n=1 Tax=Pleurodeles waltl TaxID=8319 RepID=A0AAV7LX44_PLEWA|nr:hypothetical protein NDU88_000942 [Pleurodeles waltl]
MHNISKEYAGDRKKEERGAMQGENGTEWRESGKDKMVGQKEEEACKGKRKGRQVEMREKAPVVILELKTAMEPTSLVSNASTRTGHTVETTAWTSCN